MMRPYKQLNDNIWAHKLTDWIHIRWKCFQVHPGRAPEYVLGHPLPLWSTKLLVYVEIVEIWKLSADSFKPEYKFNNRLMQ